MTIVHSFDGITLVGGAQLGRGSLDEARAIAPGIVASDGGAAACLAAGLRPLAVIGDMDSLTDPARAAFAEVLHHLPEQDTTDFEKCLTRIAADYVVGVGFLGGRMDHSLAALNVLARYRDRVVVLLGEADVVAVVPRGGITLALEKGERLSLMPLGQARVRSHGLRWDLDGDALSPDGLVSISNEAAGREVHIEAEGAVAVMLETRRLGALVSALPDAFRA